MKKEVRKMVQLFEPRLVYTGHAFCRDVAVLAEDGVIRRIGPCAQLRQEYSDAQTFSWPDTVLIPGTVNVHNHCFQSLLRGLAVDRPFLEWRDEALYKFSPLLTPKELYTGAVFAFSEMMKNGVTTVSDFFYVHNDGPESDDAIIRAAKDVGIRLVLARTMYDWPGAPAGYVETVSQASERVRCLMKQYNARPDQMTTIVPAPHSLHAASPEMVVAGHAIAQEFNTRYHIHVAEEMFEVKDVLQQHGLRPIELLDKLGVLDRRMAAVHCVWLDDHEKDLMCRAEACLEYCPSSNMFLADGVTDLTRLYHGGVTVGLGTDGACSNNRISVFEEMRMAALLQKVHRLDALDLSAKEVFLMGTEYGGQLLELPIGQISEGYRADFVGLNLNDISLQPLYDNCEQLLSNIVYSMQPTAVNKVVVNGALTVDDGQLLKIPEPEIITMVKKVMAKFQQTP